MLRLKDHNFNHQSGVISVITLMAVSALALAVVTTISTIAIDDLQMSNAGGVVDKTFYAAEAGLNEGLYRLTKNSSPNKDYSLTIDGINVLVEIDAAGTNRIIRSTATNPNGNVRRVGVLANTSSFGIGLDYAVQGGSGGIFMSNGSKVVGDVYTNGGIHPVAGIQRGRVEGNVWIAHDPGNPSAHNSLDYVDVVDVDNNGSAGTVFGGNIVNSTIDTQASYISINSSSLVNGASCNPTPHAACTVVTASPEPRTFPISDLDITDWQTEITGLGNALLVPDSNGCPNKNPYKNGTYYCINSVSQTVNFQKVSFTDGTVGNLYVGGSVANPGRLTLAGNLWVTGDIMISENSIIEIDSSLCPVDDPLTLEDETKTEEAPSWVIIAEGEVEVENNTTIEGCTDTDGNTTSFILLISTSDAGADGSSNPAPQAIYAGNNTESIIFAAIHGMLKVRHGKLVAASSEKIYLEVGAEVVFNPLYASLVVGSGGGGESIGVQFGSWQEL